jgi:two-component system phosphate regulon response regulator PhoB
MKELANIIVVEDDPTIRTILEMTLVADGYIHVSSYARGDDGLEAIRRKKPDLVLLDVMLPGLDGFAVCHGIRDRPELSGTRVIMLTAMAQPEDVVRGLECGADDYVTKPFDRKVLLARIKAVLRRGAPVSTVAGFDGLILDEENRIARLDGEELKLPKGEFKILALLAANRGRVLARQRILDCVLSEEKAVTERTIDVQIANLRRKLGRWAEHLETVRGVGYRVNS